MDTFDNILIEPNRPAIAAACNVKAGTVRQWAFQGRIPSRHWYTIAAMGLATPHELLKAGAGK